MSNPIVIVSADGHCGQTVTGFRPYLEKKWLPEFDDWASTFVDPFDDLNHVYSDRNWDSALRKKHLEEDGIVGEVLYPNTVAPFHPVPSDLAGPPEPQDYERRRAGAHAYNRWLVEFCNDLPGRRAGIAEILFNNPEHALEDLKWARDNGLFGGLMLPSLSGGKIAPVWDPVYDPIWAACVDMDIPVSHHGGGGTGEHGFTGGMARLLYLTEFQYFSNRAVWHMIWGGVFERHPKLRLVITEQDMGSMLDQAHYHNYMWAMLKGAGDDTPSQGARELLGDFIDSLPMKPGDYLQRNCWFGCSFLGARDTARRHEIGPDRIMWGCDYPHTEATWPHSRNAIAEAVKGVPDQEVLDIIGRNAIKFYGFNEATLNKAALTIGPQPEEILRAA